MFSLRSVFIVLLAQLCFIKVGQASYTLPNKHGGSYDSLTISAHAFFNVTHSGIQGERYLLNQQFTNVKIYSDIRYTEWSRIHGLLIYNSAPSPLYPRFYMDEIFLELKKTSLTKWFTVGGKQWVPFGNYKNDLIYKPLTKALGQTNEYAVLVGYDDFYYSKLAFFRPETRIQSSSLPLYYTIAIGMHDKKQDHAYDIGASYLYSLAESSLFQYNKGFGGYLNQNIQSHVPGIATYTNLRYKKFTTYLTYVSAIKTFHANELSYQGNPAMPTAFSIQSGYEVTVKNIPSKVIGFYDRTFQALALRLPEQRLGVGLNVYPSKYLDLQFQYAKDYNYGTGVVASGLGKQIKGRSTPTNTLALQVVINF
jgi:hypothetical protein